MQAHRQTGCTLWWWAIKMKHVFNICLFCSGGPAAWTFVLFFHHSLQPCCICVSHYKQTPSSLLSDELACFCVEHHAITETSIEFVQCMIFFKIIIRNINFPNWKTTNAATFPHTVCWMQCVVLMCQIYGLCL